MYQYTDADQLLPESNWYLLILTQTCTTEEVSHSCCVQLSHLSFMMPPNWSNRKTLEEHSIPGGFR